MTIEYCKNSTLREVYAAVAGLPAVVVPSEFGLLQTRFAREWPQHQFSTIRALLPTTASAPASVDQEVPPLWGGQIAWDEGKWVGRWGHRLVALHRLVQDGEQYRTYAATMRPTLARWLALAREAYDFAGVDFGVASVTFGYVNAFDLDPADGDLSEWFRFNFAIDAAGVQDGLSELAVGARIPRPDQQARAQVNLSAQQADGTVRVSVHSVVERDVPDGTTFRQGEALLAEVDAAKSLAKDTFFSFVTDRTLELMGATDVEPEA